MLDTFIARRNRDWRDARRVLAATFTVNVSPARAEARVYLDTFDWRLFRAGLHLVHADEALSLSDISSGELVARAPWPRHDLPRFAPDLPAADLRAFAGPVIGSRALMPVARVRVRHRTLAAHTRDGHAVAGIRAEAVTVRDGTRLRTLHGLLVDAAPGGRGRRRSTVSRALATAGYGASTTSWFETVVRAAGAVPGGYAPRPRIAVTAETPARDAVAAIFLRLLGVMRRNVPGIVDDIDTEFLHDYRVALRRTRTGLGQLQGILPAETEQNFRERFRLLAGPTGAVRDLDVLLLRRDRYHGRLPEAFRAGLDVTFDDLERTRERARASLVKLLKSREHAALLRDWKRALDTLAGGGPGGVLADEPAVAVARRVIHRRHARIRRVATASAAFDDATLHRVRIDCKKLRYVLEFFEAGLGRKAAGLIAAIEKLQDVLGENHDLAVQTRVFEDALHELSPADEASRMRAAALGGIITLLDARRRKVRMRCERRLHAFTAPLPSGL